MIDCRPGRWHRRLAVVCESSAGQTSQFKLGCCFFVVWSDSSLAFLTDWVHNQLATVQLAAAVVPCSAARPQYKENIETVAMAMRSAAGSSMVTSSITRLLRESEHCSTSLWWRYWFQAKSNISILLAMEEREIGAEGLLGEARVPRSGYGCYVSGNCGGSCKTRKIGIRPSI